MNLLNLYRLLLRRKLVVIPMVVLSIAAIAYAYVSAPPVYRSSGALALANPAMPDTSEPGVTTPEGADNPYYRYGDLSVIVDILTRQVSSPTVGDEMVAKGLTGTYMVGSTAALDRGPIVEVTTEAPSSEASMASAQIVMDEVKEQLQQLQDREQTAKDYQIFAIEVGAPQPGTKVFSGTLRRVMMVTVLMGVATLGAAVLTDAFFGWRRKRRAAKSGVASADADGSDAVEVAPNPTPEPATAPARSTAAVAVHAQASAEDSSIDADGDASPWWPDGSGEGAPTTVRRARSRRQSPAARRVPRR